MDARRDVQLHADVLILELRIDQRADHARGGSSDAGLEAARGHRHFVADVQLGLLSVHDANLRILEQARGGIGEQRIGSGTRQRNAVVRAQR